MKTRFAPSPTGFLHLGHAFSALTVWQVAQEHGGEAHLRIEDFDSQRCRPDYEAAILEDLAWLGLSWPTPFRRVSDHLDDYTKVLDALTAQGLTYACSCTRGMIRDAGATPGWDGLVYPGTCRHRSADDAAPDDAIRLNLAAALDLIDGKIAFEEIGPLHAGTHEIDRAELLKNIGDPVLKRRITGDYAYHFVAPHDDAVQKMTHVVRGADLWHATFLHVVLQRLMGWPTPIYLHHDLIRDDQGKRLAKIDHSKALRTYRDEGATPDDIKRLLSSSV